MSAPLLSADRLSKSYGGVHALRDVSFELRSGEIRALIGPNGAGKSTCFNILNGQLRPDRGRILIEGRDATNLSAREIWSSGVGRTFQVAAAFLSMTVRENVEVGVASYRHRGRSGRPVGSGADEGVERLLERVGLTELRDQPCRELAYGDLKRLELALALSNAPTLLLMDEPTAGMTQADRIELMDLVTGLARERQIGVLFTEHDVDVVFGYSDRVMVLDRGELIACGTPEDVRRDPKVRAVYLGDAGPPVSP